jgi:hypothetical protein
MPPALPIRFRLYYSAKQIILLRKTLNNATNRTRGKRVISPFHNLKLGLQTVFLRRVNVRAWAATPGQFAALAIAVFFIDIALYRTFYKGAVNFNWYAVREPAFDVLVLLVIGWLATRFSLKRVSPLAISTALLAATLWLDVIYVGAFHLIGVISNDNARWAESISYYAYYLWLLLIAIVLIKRAAQLTRGRTVLAILPIAASFMFSMYVPMNRLWYERVDSEAQTDTVSPVTEEMLYLQPRVAEQVMNALLPNRRGIPDLYFIGFAPHASQDVFMKESEVFRALADERFDTRGRSILLVNNNKTLRRHPLATVTNLRATLTRIGKLIDKDEDVVVLYLTSHGSTTHELSSDYWPLKLDELDPTLLKRLLDDARIKWRVVIVSACYSGGFIEPLRNPNTLVMTASDAANTSFGCDAEADFTYFAKALVDEQLRQTYSFQEAFNNAVPVIKEREQKQRQEFSNPQIFAGEAIQTKLRTIEHRLAARGKKYR